MIKISVYQDFFVNFTSLWSNDKILNVILIADRKKQGLKAIRPYGAIVISVSIPFPEFYERVSCCPMMRGFLTICAGHSFTEWRAHMALYGCPPSTMKDSKKLQVCWSCSGLVAYASFQGTYIRGHSIRVRGNVPTAIEEPLLEVNMTTMQLRTKLR